MAAQADVYTEGNMLVFEATFYDEIGNTLINPTLVAFGYRVNGGEISSFIYGTGNEVIRVSVGTYRISVDSTSLPGTWVWEWQSSGTGQAVVSSSLTVVPAPMQLL